MNTIEKNDVDISKLFNWGNEFPIYDSMGKELTRAWIRLVGDAELNRCRVFALRESAKLRKALKDEDSDERWAYIADIDVLEFENLVETVLIYMTRDITTQAMKEIKIPLPKEPDSESSLEEQEEYQAKVDAYPEERSKLVREYVERVLDRERNRLLSKSKEDVYKEFLSSAINVICEEEMLKRFREMCAFFGTFTDKEYKNRMFKSFEEFDNLPTDIKSQLVEYYSVLEIGGEDLKKLLEATQ